MQTIHIYGHVAAQTPGLAGQPLVAGGPGHNIMGGSQCTGQFAGQFGMCGMQNLPPSHPRTFGWSHAISLELHIVGQCAGHGFPLSSFAVASKLGKQAAGPMHGLSGKRA